MVKKILALALSMAMVFSVLPATALQAADNGPEMVVREEPAVAAASEEELGENVARAAKAGGKLYEYSWRFTGCNE